MSSSPRSARRMAFALFVSLCTHPFTAASSGGLPTPDVAAQLDQYLAATFHPDAPGASVLVARQGTVVLHRGYGMADLELGVPMSATQVLPICSLTKQFTAVAILQLVEAGKLKLEDELARFLPEYPTSAPVTIEQLLRHTAGIPSIEEQPEARKHWAEELTPRQILDYTRSQPLAFAPGSDWKYSNTGYYLLGRVIEKVSGQSYPEYLATHVLGPAGLAHTAYPAGGRIIPQRAPGYSRAGKRWRDAPCFNFTQADSSGALLSSVEDLWTWDRALQSGRLISRASLQRAYSDVLLPDGRATHYGLGWEVTRLGGHAAIGHAGGTPGFAAFEARVPEAELYVAILCNTDAPPRELRVVAARLVALALGDPVDAAAAELTLPPAALPDFVGTYQVGPDANFVVTLKDGKLIAQLGRGRRPLKAVGPDEFAAGDDGMRFHFARDAAQHVVKIVVTPDGPGPDLIWPRVPSAP